MKNFGFFLVGITVWALKWVFNMCHTRVGCFLSLIFWSWFMKKIGWLESADRDQFLMITGIAAGLSLHYWCNRK